MIPEDCVKCLVICCNNQVHEMRNASISLKYVADCLDKGHTNRDLIDRLIKDVERLGKALKNCKAGL